MHLYGSCRSADKGGSGSALKAAAGGRHGQLAATTLHDGWHRLRRARSWRYAVLLFADLLVPHPSLAFRLPAALPGASPLLPAPCLLPCQASCWTSRWCCSTTACSATPSKLPAGQSGAVPCRRSPISNSERRLRVAIACAYSLHLACVGCAPTPRCKLARRRACRFTVPSRLIAESVGVMPVHAHAAQSGRPPSADVQVGLVLRARPLGVEQPGGEVGKWGALCSAATCSASVPTGTCEPRLPCCPQERHNRLAAALALSELTQEKDVRAVVAKWGREGFVSKSERVPQGCTCERLPQPSRRCKPTRRPFAPTPSPATPKRLAPAVPGRCSGAVSWADPEAATGRRQVDGHGSAAVRERGLVAAGHAVFQPVSGGFAGLPCGPALRAGRQELSTAPAAGCCVVAKPLWWWINSNRGRCWQSRWLASAPVLVQMAAAGVRQDLLPLMKVPGMDASKARALFKAGLRDTQVGGAA